jgi:hypothetical protein
MVSSVDARPGATIGAVTVNRIRFEGSAVLAVDVATSVADGVGLISSAPVSNLDEKKTIGDTEVAVIGSLAAHSEF